MITHALGSQHVRLTLVPPKPPDAHIAVRMNTVSTVVLFTHAISLPMQTMGMRRPLLSSECATPTHQSSSPYSPTAPFPHTFGSLTFCTHSVTSALKNKTLLYVQIISLFDCTLLVCNMHVCVCASMAGCWKLGSGLFCSLYSTTQCCWQTGYPPEWSRAIAWNSLTICLEAG